MSTSVLVIAGEISGDMHAARVVEAVRARDPSVRFWGIGGDELRAAGMDVLYDTRDMAVMGVWEVLKRYAFFRRVFHDMIRRAREQRPDAVLLVDYPGFNLRLAKRLHAMGIKVLYYICPQVWAWHRSRIARMARMVDRLMVIFPFEVDVFRDTGLKVDFVGHPLVDVVRPVWESGGEPLPWPTAQRVALLPGSRRQEIERILPVMIEAAARLEQDQPDVCFMIAAPSDKMADVSRDLLDRSARKPSRISIETGKTRSILRQARAAMVASGTATVEAALMRCPMIVIYKTAPITYWFARRLVRVDHIGMVNIIAGRRLCPEFIQDEARADTISYALRRLLTQKGEYQTVVEGLEQVALALGGGGASEKTAQIILQETAS